MNSVLVTEGIDDITLQAMPEDDLERKRQMRWAQDERRREKKKNSKEADIEESKKLKDVMSEQTRLDSIQSFREYSRLLQEEMKVVSEPSIGVSGEL